MGKMKELFIQEQERKEMLEDKNLQDYHLDDEYWEEQAKWQELYEKYEKEQLEKEAEELYNKQNKEKP